MRDKDNEETEGVCHVAIDPAHGQRITIKIIDRVPLKDEMKNHSLCYEYRVSNFQFNLSLKLF